MNTITAVDDLLEAETVVGQGEGAVELGSQIAELTPLDDRQLQDQLSTLQSQVFLMAELREQEGEWQMTPLEPL